MRSLLRTLAHGLKDAIAPARCMRCLQEGSWHCLECRKNTRSYKLSCIVCGSKKAGGKTCRACQHETLLTGVISAGPYYSPALRRGIHWLKFKSIREIADTLSWLVIPHLPVIAPFHELETQALLVPIPLYPRRLRERGFNQSLALAEALSRHTTIPVADILTRERSTWTQSHLPEDLRKQNLQEAFTLSAVIPAQYRFIILVDDVATTGSTLAAAANILPKDRQLWGLAIARG